MKSDYDELVSEFEDEEVKNASEQAMDTFIGEKIDSEPNIEVLFFFDPENVKLTKGEVVNELVSYWGYKPVDAERVFDKFFEVEGL